MDRHFTLEYWKDNDWFVGRLKEVPSVFSQGETLSKLEENIREAFSLVISDTETGIPAEKQTKDLVISI